MLQFAAERIDITPREPVHMGASGKFTGLSTGIDSPLEANVLCLIDKASEITVVLVSMDLLYPGQTITEAVRREFAHRRGTYIFVTATHTHRAPMTDLNKPNLGKFNAKYVELVVAQLEQVIDNCLASRENVDRVRAGCKTANSSINRRLRKRLVVSRHPRLNSFVIAPNPCGAKDEIVTVVEVHRSSGIACVLWNYACHPVGHPENDRISAHYPGWIRDQIRAQVGDHVPVLFLQGFSGNTRPSGTTRVHSTRRKLRQLISGRLFEDFHEADYARWCDTLSKVVEDARINSTDVPDSPLSVRVTRRAAEDFIEGAPGEMEVAKISLGESIQLFLATGELMVEHGLELRQRFPTAHVMPVGCVGDVLGYLPTQAIQDEGGYEGGGFTSQFNLGPLRSEAAKRLDEMLASFEA